MSLAGSLHGLLAPLAALLTVLCVVPYVVDMRQGTTRPHRTSWFVFAALAAVATAGQVADGDRAGAWLSGGAAVAFSLVFGLSLRRGVGGTAPLDVLALAVAAAGVGVWAVSGHALVAVLAVLVAETGAVALTAAKAWRAPATETTATWAVDAAAGAVALLGVTRWTAGDIVYPAHHLLANMVVLGAIFLGRRAAAPTPVARTPS